MNTRKTAMSSSIGPGSKRLSWTFDDLNMIVMSNNFISILFIETTFIVFNANMLSEKVARDPQRFRGGA